MKTIILTQAEIELILGRIEVETQWGLEVYNQEELDSFASIKAKLS